jgi:hypothetical protein
MKKAVATLLFLTLVPAIGWTASSTLLKFDGGIGVVPVTIGTTPVVDAAGNPTGETVPFAPTLVRGVSPGGQPWVISRLTADIKVDGSITVDGRGLLLAGGNAIGTPGGQSVVATLFCGNVAHSTPAGNAVKLADNGDFKIDDVLDNGPVSPCATPVLLIRNVVTVNGVLVPGRWFAAGIEKLN